MGEDLEGPESQKNFRQELTALLERLAQHGIDFTPEDLGHLSGMDEDELTEYFFQTLIEAEVDDPEAFMVEHNIVEMFKLFGPDQLAARNEPGYLVDELDEQDRKEGRGSYGRND